MGRIRNVYEGTEFWAFNSDSVQKNFVVELLFEKKKHIWPCYILVLRLQLNPRNSRSLHFQEANVQNG